jgi:ribosomal protein S18 acetylase RimI-like enzyme
MAQVASHHPDLLPTPDDGGVVRVAPEHRREGVGRLLGLKPGDAGVSRFLDAAALEGTDLSLFWGLPAMRAQEGAFEEVCLVVPGTGRTGMVFASAGEDVGPADRTRVSRRGALIDRVCAIISRGVDHQGMISPHAQDLVLGQALLEPEHVNLAKSFEAGGFTRLADLEYLKRDLPRRYSGDQVRWPAGVTVTPLNRLSPDEGDRQLAEAMTRSYEDTLDCPALCGMRRLPDVLDSHRSVGVYDPRLWYVVTHDGRPEGCMLLSAVPASESVELVYLGLGRSLRGKGLGRGLLTLAISELSGREERSLACAVDSQNAPALALYRAMRFRRFARRVALVRPLRAAHGV